MKRYRYTFSAFFKYPFFTIIICFLAMVRSYAQDPAQYGTPFTGVPDIRDINMYEVNTRAFSPAGNFAGVSARLDSLKALGINVIYLMPVYPVPPVDTASSINSPYCIENFEAVGSEFGSLSDLRSLVASAHTRNMSVIMDFVVNQTAWNHPWITQHPSWYNHNADGTIAQMSTYADVASLNLNNDTVRNKLDSAMRFWVFTANIDGFRCDFADNPPIPFWTYVIANLRGITTHKLIMMAEGTRSANYTAGFDLNFGYQSYYNSFVPIYQSGAHVTDIDNSNNAEYTDATGTQQIVRFLTNHDENATNDAADKDGTAVYLFGGDSGSAAMFVTAAYMKGVPMVYTGQEVDFATPIAFPFTGITVDWSTSYASEKQYGRILNYRTSSTALRRGTLTSYDNNYVAAFTKVSGSETIFVMDNLQNGAQVFRPASTLTGMTWFNSFTGARYTLGSSVTLAPYQYIVLTTLGADTTATGITKLSSGSGPATATIYPNPAAHNHFFVLLKDLPDGEVATLTVKNISGQTVLSTLLSASGQIENSLAPGIYFVSIRSESLDVIHKLIIQ